MCSLVLAVRVICFCAFLGIDFLLFQQNQLMGSTIFVLRFRILKVHRHILISQSVWITTLNFFKVKSKPKSLFGWSSTGSIKPPPAPQSNDGCLKHLYTEVGGFSGQQFAIGKCTFQCCNRCLLSWPMGSSYRSFDFEQSSRESLGIFLPTTYSTVWDFAISSSQNNRPREI